MVWLVFFIIIDHRLESRMASSPFVAMIDSYLAYYDTNYKYTTIYNLMSPRRRDRAPYSSKNKKKVLDDHEGRKALWARLQFSLDGEPDPWFEFDKAAVDTRQFDALSV